MRVICRRERPSAGAQLSLLEQAHGWRYQLFATNTLTGQLAFLKARHRAHARVADRIRSRQGHRHRTPALDLVCDQPGLVGGRHDRG